MPAAQELTYPFAGGEVFLSTPTWQGVARQLIHLAEFSGGIQVVDALGGAGKTTFAHHVAGLFVEGICDGVIAIPIGLAAEQVFESLLSMLSLDESYGISIGASLIALRKYDTELKHVQQRKVIIIDDAHRLDDQTLAALASLFQGDLDSESGLALLLIGEPGVASRLDALNLIDVEVRDCTLPAFSLDEGRRLLEDEYGAVFPGKAFPFEESLIARIWHEAGGRPGELLALAQAEWAESSARSAAWWKSSRLWQVIIPLIMLSVMIWGFLARDLWLNSGSGTADDMPAAPAAVLNQDSGDAVDSEIDSAIGVGLVKPAANFVDESVEKSDLESDVVVDDYPGATTTGNQLTASGDQAVYPSKIHSGSASVPFSQVREEGNVSGSSLDLAKGIVTPREDAESGNTPAQTDEPKAAKLANKSQAIKPAQPVRKPEVAQLEAAQLDGLTDDESQLMGLSDQGYVLQVLAANSRKSLEQFVKVQVNRSNLRIYRSMRSGKSWYVVVEGYYADKESALSAMSNLPSSQLKSGPWPKSTATVKFEIAAFQQQLP